MALNKAATEQILHLELPAGVRLDKFLAAELGEGNQGLSRSQLQRLIEQGQITGISEKNLKSSFKAKRATAITITLPPEKPAEILPFAASIPVLYEDEYLAIVHKPAGMTVHPGAATGNDTLVHALVGQIKKLAPHAERPGIVHRLDRETEGLMVIAKTDKARAALAGLFADRQVHKTYQAIVWGSVELPEKIDGFIWRDRRNRKKMKFGYEAPEKGIRAREAQLVFLRQTRYKFGTELEINLITGRTHQIRATCAQLNAPIIGDAIYGDDAGRAKTYKVGREKRDDLSACGMLLVAKSIEFAHPFKRKKIKFAIELPARFAEARSLLK
ncbi:ribosomal large subunit pseudouridine synthase D [Turneriella parva DSM 21527]|uniref:Pseudouridine synthase n=1 Tax=Turneriella parva (strain ATCC BAA-1111 / DSM 21527 / NCTC 11395 / H) TaxID=869212 RepID=I4BBC5_TURPD|nr:ribosomal large subunit pseudouridine synthase D [Turneriella parva DSM 21527]